MKRKKFIDIYNEYLAVHENLISIRKKIIIQQFCCIALFLLLCLNTFLPSSVTLFSWFIIGCTWLYLANKESHYSTLKKRLANMKYIGDLNEVFPFDDSITYNIITKNAFHIEQHFIENEGIPGWLILDMHEEIKEEKLRILKQTDLDGAISNNSELKLMLEQINYIYQKGME